MKRKKGGYAQQIKRLFTKLKRGSGKASLRSVDDPMDQLLRGILSTFASESRAGAAMAKLSAAVVDLNELRVTPISEIVEIIGPDYPSCRAAGEEISRALNGVFNRVHRVDLDFLRTSSHKAVESFLASLDGVGAHARATVMLRCFGDRVVPVDAHMHAFLRAKDYIPENATVEEAQKWLTRQTKERDVVSFYVLLKRFAAAHAPRKAAGKPTATGESKVKAAPAKKPPERKTKKAKKTGKTTASATTARPRKAPAGKPTKKKGAASKKRAGTSKARRPGGGRSR